MVESYYGAASDGGLFERPWEIPRLGGSGTGSSNQRSIGQAGFGSTFGENQSAWASTGIGGGFANWPGKLQPAWTGSLMQHRGMFGGFGVRTGGAY